MSYCYVDFCYQYMMINVLLTSIFQEPIFSYLIFNANGCKTGVRYGRGTPKAES